MEHCTIFLILIILMIGKSIRYILLSLFLNHGLQNHFITIISRVLGNSDLSLTLLYRGSRDGFSAKSFHDKCDNKGATITIIKNALNYSFGGYTNISWNSPNDSEYKTDSGAFLFSIYPQMNIINIKNHITNHQLAIYHDSSYGPAFGCNYDLWISSNCNQNNYSYVYPSTYKFESPMLVGGNCHGIVYFKVLDYEVFLVN